MSLERRGHDTKYKLNMSKMSVKECFRLGGLLSPVLLFCKLFGINMADGSVCAQDFHDLIEIEPSVVESRADSKLRGRLEEAQRLRLTPLLAYTLPLAEDKTMAVAYHCERPECIVEFLHAMAVTPHTTTCVAVTPLRGNGELITVLDPTKGLDSPKEYDCVTFSGGTLEQLLDRHLVRWERAVVDSLPRKDLLRQYMLERNQKVHQRLVRRGLYSPVTGGYSG